MKINSILGLNRCNVRKFLWSWMRIIPISMICLAPIAAPVSWAGQVSYSASNLPYSYETAGISPAQVREFNIEITNDFTVAEMTVDFTVFASNVFKTDFKIISPSGTTVWLADLSCNQIPVSFGRRTYEDESQTTNDSPDPIGTTGIPATYRFEDSGADLGRQTHDGLACDQKWKEQYPDWPSAAPGWGRTGAWAQLPNDVAYKPARDSFALFAGESSAGTWKIWAKDYKVGPPNPWQAPTIIQNVTLNFTENDEPTVVDAVISDPSPSPGDTVTLAVTFSEDMDTSKTPVLSFPNEDPTSVWTYQSADSGWNGTLDTFTASYVVVDPLTTTFDEAVIDVSVAEVTDQAGNDVDNSSLKTFALEIVENLQPSVIDATISDPAPSLGDSVSLAVTFSEDMDTSKTPALSFPNEDPMSIWTYQSAGSGWNGSLRTFTASYVVVASLATTFDEAAIDVSVAGVTDLAGNGVDNSTLETFALEVVENSLPGLNAVSINSIGTPDPTRAKIGDEIEVTFSADEDLATDVDTKPIVIIAGAEATVAGGPRDFVATVTVTDAMSPGSADFEIAYQDVAGNSGPAVSSTTDGTSVTIGVSTEIKQRVIANFVINRMNNMLNNQPNLTQFIDGSSNRGAGLLGSFALSANEQGFTSSFSSSLGQIWEQQKLGEERNGAATNNDHNTVDSADFTDPLMINRYSTIRAAQSLQPMQKQPESSRNSQSEYTEERIYGLATGKATASAAAAASVSDSSHLSEAQRRGYDMWMQVNGARSKTGGSESNLWIGHFGGHIFVRPNLLIGGLVQLDWAEETNDSLGSSVDGLGWMAGPYITAKFPEHNLFLDARAAWGQSNNTMKLDADGTNDDFDTERWLISAKLSGVIEANDWIIRPAVSVSYFRGDTTRLHR